MPLEELTLDDLTWEDLVQAARSRIPAASKGQWTLHAPVDPGITLLELFAYQLEERLYWLDQPCDSRARAILKLLGVRPRSTATAATVLAFSSPSGSNDQSFAVIKRDTPLQPAAQANALTPTRAQRNAPLLPTFTTQHPILYFPLLADRNAVELWFGAKDRTQDLLQGRAPRLEIDAAGGLEVNIRLHLKAPIPSNRSGTLSLFLDVEAPKGMVPQWLPGAAAPAPAADVTWWYRTQTNGYQPFPATLVRDGTKGLRRPGLVLLPIRDGMDWRHNGDTMCELRMVIRAAHFAAPPRLRQIVPNAVIARHRQRVNLDDLEAGEAEKFVEVIRNWNLTQTPDLSVPLPFPEQTILPRSVHLRLQRDAGQRLERWHPVDDLTMSGPGDRYFVVDRETSQIRFGDGYHGRLPVGETVTANVSLRIGGGRSGNVSAGRDWETSETSDGTWHAVNPVAAEGGDEAETLADAARRAAHDWRQPTRTVTAADFEFLAQHVPGAAIGRAHAVVGHHPQFPCKPVEGAVTVFVVPDVPMPEDEEWLAAPQVWAALVPDAPTLAAVVRHLERARLVTQEVFVRPTTYAPIAVDVSIGGVPADAERVRGAATLELYRFFHPLWGGADGTGWPFGGDIYPSAVMQRVQNVLPAGLIVTRAAIARVGQSDTATACAPFPVDPLELPALAQVRLHFAPLAQTEGGLG